MITIIDREFAVYTARQKYYNDRTKYIDQLKATAIEKLPVAYDDTYWYLKKLDYDDKLAVLAATEDQKHENNLNELSELEILNSAIENKKEIIGKDYNDKKQKEKVKKEDENIKNRLEAELRNPDLTPQERQRISTEITQLDAAIGTINTEIHGLDNKISEEKTAINGLDEQRKPLVESIQRKEKIKQAKDEIQKEIGMASLEAALLIINILHDGSWDKNKEKLAEIGLKLSLKLAGIGLSFVPIVGPFANMIVDGIASMAFGGNGEDPVLKKLEAIQDTLNKINEQLSAIGDRLNEVEQNIIKKIKEQGEEIIQRVGAENVKNEVNRLVRESKSFAEEDMMSIVNELIDNYAENTSKKRTRKLIEGAMGFIDPVSKEEYMPYRLDLFLETTIGFGLKDLDSANFNYESYDSECYLSKLNRLLVSTQGVSVQDYGEAYNDVLNLVNSFLVIQATNAEMAVTCASIGALKLGETIKEVEEADQEYLEIIDAFYTHFYATKQGVQISKTLGTAILAATAFNCKDVLEIFGAAKSNGVGSLDYANILLYNPNIKKYIDGYTSNNVCTYVERIEELKSSWKLRFGNAQGLAFLGKPMIEKTTISQNFLMHDANHNVMLKPYSTLFENSMKWVPIVMKDGSNYRVGIKDGKEGDSIHYLEDNKIKIQVRPHDIFDNKEGAKKTKYDNHDGTILFAEGNIQILEDIEYKTGYGNDIFLKLSSNKVSNEHTLNLIQKEKVLTIVLSFKGDKTLSFSPSGQFEISDKTSSEFIPTTKAKSIYTSLEIRQDESKRFALAIINPDGTIVTKF